MLKAYDWEWRPNDSEDDPGPEDAAAFHDWVDRCAELRDNAERSSERLFAGTASTGR
jgi:hypothetical protein